jgi:hypothetical protein
MTALNRFVDVLGGEFRGDNHRGEGARFIVTLPTAGVHFHEHQP